MSYTSFWPYSQKLVLLVMQMAFEALSIACTLKSNYCLYNCSAILLNSYNNISLCSEWKLGVGRELRIKRKRLEHKPGKNGALYLINLQDAPGIALEAATGLIQEALHCQRVHWAIHWAAQPKEEMPALTPVGGKNERKTENKFFK